MKRWAFWKTLVVIATALLSVTAIGLCMFWGYLARYEAAHPVGAMNAYFASLKSGDTQKLINDSEFPFDAYNTEQAYLQYLRKKYQNGEGSWQYAETAADPATGTYTYDVYENDQKYGTLYLARQGENWTVRSDWAYAEEIVISASMEVLVNGAPVKADKKGETPSLFEGIQDDMPVLSTYTVQTLLAPTVSLKEGESVLTSREDGSCRISGAVSEQDTKALQSLAEKAARTYACFISGDVKLKKLLALLEDGTPFASGVRTYDAKWYNEHVSVEFKDLQVKTPMMWTQDIFSAEVTFDFVVSRGYDEHTYPTAYDIAFRRTKNGFLVINIAPK